MKVNYDLKMEEILKEVTQSGKKKRLLIHSCCGPCSSSVLEYLKDYFKNFNDSISKSLGFLWSPIDFTLKVLNSARSQTANPTGSTCDIGASVKLCAWRYSLPQIWDLLQKFLQAAVVMLFIFAYWRKVANIFDMDKSEEVKE